MTRKLMNLSLRSGSSAALPFVASLSEHPPADSITATRFLLRAFIALWILALLALAPSDLYARQAATSVPRNFRWQSRQESTDNSPQQNPVRSAVPQGPSATPQETNSAAQLGSIVGTALDVNGNAVANATVVLQGPAATSRQIVKTNDDGFFEIHGVPPDIPYRLTISAKGFADWTSHDITLAPGQYEMLTGIRMQIHELRTTVTVSPKTAEEIATQQVKQEELQRGFGVIPNFLEVYDPNPQPLTWKLKFRLAFKVTFDPITVTGAGLLAGANEVGGTPKYADGVKGFAERFGASYANQFTDTMIADGLLPSLLHQDPRYFYQGTGPAKSRVLHAISSVFITRGDNGRHQPNYSLLGGDLASAAIANTYYPNPNRGAGLVFQNFGVNVAVHASGRLLQEFVFHPPSRHSSQQVP